MTEQASVSWKTFFVFLAGNTNGAHRDLVEKLKGVGHTEVNSPEECDYVLVFCPIASRVGTDIKEAQDKMPTGKPVILVVMHHTFNSGLIVAESRRLVTNPNVLLTVDRLFYDQHFLECSRNDIALYEIETYLGVSSYQVSWWETIKNTIRHPACIGLIVGLGALTVALIIYFEVMK